MTGEIDRFSIDKLVKMLTQAGMEIEISVKPKVA